MKSAKPVLCILLFFLLGAACGGLVTHMIYKGCFGPMVRGDHKEREEIILQRLSKRLDLDDRQREQVRGIIKETHAEMDAIRKQYQPQMMTVLENGRVKVTKILRPEQQAKFEQFLAERKAKREKER